MCSVFKWHFSIFLFLFVLLYAMMLPQGAATFPMTPFQRQTLYDAHAREKLLSHGRQNIRALSHPKYFWIPASLGLHNFSRDVNIDHKRLLSLNTTHPKHASFCGIFVNCQHPMTTKHCHVDRYWAVCTVFDAPFWKIVRLRCHVHALARSNEVVHATTATYIFRIEISTTVRNSDFCVSRLIFGVSGCIRKILGSAFETRVTVLHTVHKYNGPTILTVSCRSLLYTSIPSTKRDFWKFIGRILNSRLQCAATFCDSGTSRGYLSRTPHR